MVNVRLTRKCLVACRCKDDVKTFFPLVQRDTNQKLCSDILGKYTNESILGISANEMIRINRKYRK